MKRLALILFVLCFLVSCKKSEINPDLVKFAETKFEISAGNFEVPLNMLDHELIQDINISGETSDGKQAMFLLTWGHLPWVDTLYFASHINILDLNVSYIHFQNQRNYFMGTLIGSDSTVKVKGSVIIRYKNVQKNP